MKSVLRFLTQLAVGLFMFVFGPFISKRTDKLFDIESEELEPQFVGQNAIVVELVTFESGKVKFMGATWRARISSKCTETSISPGSIVTIASTESNVLHVQ